MQFQILTIFPELFENFTQFGLISRALKNGLVQLDAQQLRRHAINTQGQLDDTPYGGGSGMVLRPEPALAAINEAKAKDPEATVILFTPRGRPLRQPLARSLYQQAKERNGGFILLCCRYEGVDERIAEHYVDHQISIGDYVMMGGESAAMVFVEVLSRFVPGVLGNPESVQEESFESPLLEYPQYTKPQQFMGHDVPAPLLSGHHAEIKRWRGERAREDTLLRRPDLYSEYVRQQGLEQRTPPLAGELSVALIHYPVVNKGGETITSSVTNLDIHDIARSSRTYGLTRYYVVHPTKALRRLMHKICDHWSEGYGLTYNPNRSDALETVSTVPDLDDVLLDIQARTGALPKIIATSARAGGEMVSFSTMRTILARDPGPFLLLLGTGWGLHPDVLCRAAYRLEPVQGFTNYNHLSVRAAAAIMFDRLLGVPS